MRGPGKGSLAIILGLLVGAVVSRAFIQRMGDDVETLRPSPRTVEQAPLPDPMEIAKPHFEQARSQVEGVVDSKLVPIRRFFQDAKTNTPDFAKSALGWSSKWRLLQDRFPLSRGGEHEKFIRQNFENMVFSPDQLESVINGTIADYLAEIRSIENQMLVSLRADFAGFSDVFPIVKAEADVWESQFEQAIRRAVADSGSDLRSEIGTQLVSIVGGELLAQVAIRIGVSAGILGAGTVSGWATLGVGFLVGVIVDQVVCWIWDWWADPEGDLAGNLNRRLDELSILICEGDEKVSGLRSRFLDIARRRDEIRRAAVLELVQSRVEK